MERDDSPMDRDFHRVHFRKLHTFVKLLHHLIILFLQLPLLLQYRIKLLLSPLQPLIPPLQIRPKHIDSKIQRSVLLLIDQQIAIPIDIAGIVLRFEVDIRHFLFYLGDLVDQFLFVGVLVLHLIGCVV